MISKEEVESISAMAEEYKNPPTPRTGYQTEKLYDKLSERVMRNLDGLLEAARKGVV